MHTRRQNRIGRLIKAMAYSREQHINSMESALSGAIRHYYRVKLAALNAKTDQVEKWQQHEEQFLGQFVDALTHELKGKRDRRKAAAQALQELQSQNLARQRGETAQFEATYKIDVVKSLPADVDEGFFVKVRQIVDYYYPPRGRSVK
jgi:hypothetical protein